MSRDDEVCISSDQFIYFMYGQELFNIIKSKPQRFIVSSIFVCVRDILSKRIYSIPCLDRNGLRAKCVAFGFISLYPFCYFKIVSLNQRQSFFSSDFQKIINMVNISCLPNPITDLVRK
ncbi:hypothetical protein AYJ66_17250 [Dietzia cinnamea]|nr:hypothetical protein AYJ66_17250 [Dietzia cinnamea]